LLGFGANLLLEVAISAEGTASTVYDIDEAMDYAAGNAEVPVAVSGMTLEAALPYDLFGKPDAGDSFKVRVVVSEGESRDIQVVPKGGPGQLIVPDLGLTTPILTIADPEKDDHGPGSYVYPSDGVFGSRAYDLIEFAVAEDDNNLIFRFTFAGKLNNDWGAPNGMGIHTLDVYVDAVEGGERMLLGGRNASVPEDSGWDFLLWAEGWTPGVYGPPSNESIEPVPIGDVSTMTIVSDPGQSKITLRVPKRVFAESLGLGPEDLAPATWGYLGVVMSQEGYPSSGVWRIRDVQEQAAQWRFGGAPAESSTHTRIVDVAYPADFEVTQEVALSDFTPQLVEATEFDALTPDDFAQLPLVRP
jgi:carbohydrate-binding DOMON domain-containing protein